MGLRTIIAASALLPAFATCVRAWQNEPDALPPERVFARVATVRRELDELRLMMGCPQNTQPEIEVKQAAPREVYFQALTLFRKADRLCFEHTRERAQQPQLATRDIRPADVYHVVDGALNCVRRVKEKYGIESPEFLEEGAGEQPTDVFQSIVQANRQLNLMLERRFAPSDVFQQITWAVGYTSRLLERFPNVETIPPEPKFEGSKRPADVYRRLLGCFRRLRSIAEQSGLEMLEFQIDPALIEEAEPSDVYDVASLIVAELAYLHSKLPAAKQPRKVYYVGRKFPSHVYQRAGILEKQLDELENLVRKNSDWLSQESSQQ